VPHYKGETKVRIEYTYTVNGVVQVSAFDERSGQPLPGPEVQLADLDISWSDKSPKEARRFEPTTIYLAFDLSGSMSGTPLAEAQKAAHAFVRKCDLNHMAVGLISFSDRVHVDLVAEGNARAIETAIKALQMGRLVVGTQATPSMKFTDALIKFVEDGTRLC
jgi:Mg-chelatase subunit ChlD